MVLKKHPFVRIPSAKVVNRFRIRGLFPNFVRII